MKRIFTTALILALMLSAVACGNAEGTDTTTTLPDTTASAPAETTGAPAAPAENKGELKTGVYTGTSSYSSGEMNMTWNFVLTLKDDGSFTLTNDAAEEKGAGTYALTDTCYTMSYADGRSCTFVVQEDGTLKMTSDFPYGIAQIQLSLVGDIIFNYDRAVAAETTAAEETKAAVTGDTFTIAAGTYAASYTKESAMAGTVVYEYTAILGEDKNFSYSVKFDMNGKTYDGSAASGTYTVNGNQFVFTDSEGKVTEGKLTADNTLVISLKASAMASSPYEVTFAPAAYTLAAGTYAASYTKESAMAGTVVYEYTATLGEDKTFSYSVKFDMNGKTYDGSAASGTYTVNGSQFVFTDSEGKVTEGKLTADNTLVISLKASAMASAPYEVTFAPAAYTLAAGTYAASYTKESAMAGTVVYEYTAVLGEDKTFSYSVKFDMNGKTYDGSAASGTYTVNGSQFVFTDSEGKVTEGKLTADNTLVISLKASAMASSPYEVTFTAGK